MYIYKESKVVCQPYELEGYIMVAMVVGYTAHDFYDNHHG